MRVTVRTALAVAAALVAATAPVATAGQEESGREGVPCVFQPTPYVMKAGPASSRIAGFLAGGPFAGPGTLTCSLQTTGTLHSDPDAATASAAGGDVVTVTPQSVFVAGSLDTAVVCTAWTPSDGGPPMYLSAGDWTVDADTPCAAMGSSGNDLVTVAAVDEPPRPVYPRAAVTLSKSFGGFMARIDSADPAPGSWTCEITEPSVTCTPPPPERGTYQVCGTVAVAVRNDSAAFVRGESGCQYGERAVATAAPRSLGVASARPRSSFGWTCRADADVLALTLWEVRCTVGA